jgi:hypothetical protein
MKIILRLSFIVLMILFIGKNNCMAQNSNESAVKAILNNLLDYSKSKAYEKAANLIAYEGGDKKRIGKESFNPLNKDEINQVKRICKKISALIELSSQYEFGEFNTMNEGDSEVYNIEVNFKSGDQKLVTSFSFIKTEKGFLLLNIN